MANNVYFLTAHTHAKEVGERLAEFVPSEDRFEVAANQWIVAFEGTTRELAEKAGIRGGDERIGTGLVFAVTTYAGRASTDLWEWLKAKGF